MTNSTAHSIESVDSEQGATERVVNQIEGCLSMGCVIRVEHASLVGPRYTPWELWGTPSMYNGNVAQILDEVAKCHTRFTDHFVRLNIEDYSCYSRFSFVMHSPGIE